MPLTSPSSTTIVNLWIREMLALMVSVSSSTPFFDGDSFQVFLKSLCKVLSKHSLELALMLNVTNLCTYFLCIIVANMLSPLCEWIMGHNAHTVPSLPFFSVEFFHVQLCNSVLYMFQTTASCLQYKQATTICMNYSYLMHIFICQKYPLYHSYTYF